MITARSVSIYFITLSALFLAACGERSLETQVNNIGTLEGQVSAKTSGLDVGDQYALTCTSWTAKLYELATADAILGATPLLTTTVAADGRYKFTGLSAAQIKLSTLSNLKYVVVIEGCGKTFKRPVTSARNQDITPASDLLLRSLTLSSRSGRQNDQVSLTEITKILGQLESQNLSTLTDVYDAITGDATLKASFQAAYGFDPTDLRYLPPDVKVGTNPATVAENSTPTFALTLTHWHPAYLKRALWYNGTTYLGEGEAAVLAISKNMQGSRPLTVRVGYSSGATSIDLAKPYAEVTVPLIVSNDYPAVAPVLTRTSPASAIATTRTLTLSLATGASLANCATFTGLALTEEQLTAPISPSDYNITCGTAVAQALPYTLLTSGEGNKTLRLWAMDSSGNISAATTLIVPLDTITPSAPTLTRISAALSNSTTVQIQNANCNDNATKILFSQTATTPATGDVAWQTCVAQNYNFTVSTGDGAKTIYAFLKDDADHISPSSNVTMTLDATLPTLTLTAAPTLNQRLKGGASFTVSWTSVETNFGTTPVTLELSSDAGSTWTSSASSLAASGSTSWTVPSYTGSTFQVRVKATDLAGNVGSSTASPSFAIDSTTPNVTLLSMTGGQLLKGGSTATITWSATDSLLATNPITIDGSSDSGATWSAIASSLANSGSYTWTVPSLNTSTYRVRVTATDAVGWTGSAASSSSITIDSTAPTVTLLSLTGGQTIPGSSAVSTISWSASDARLTTSPITLEYSANSGTSWTQIATSLANSGSYAWTVSVADAATYRVRVTAIDQVGNTATAASSSDFAITSSAPHLTQTTADLNINSKTLANVTYGGTCETGINVVVSGTETASLACPAGTWSWTTATYSSDATRTFTFKQTNGIPLSTTITATWKRDTVAPALSVVSVNSGDAITAVPQVRVDVTSVETNIEVRLGVADGSGSCQANFADNNWEAHSSLTATHLYSMPVGDGIKKVCVWTRDAALNVSVFSPVTGTDGVNQDSIDLEAGTPPVITAFSVFNDVGGGTSYTAGQRVNISWTVTDVEGLGNSPITLDYTTDAGTTWTSIVTNYGGLTGNPKTYTQSYLAFNAPGTGIFRVRIRAVDSAGNTASPVISNVQNGIRWSVYAGNTDRGIGGEAKSVRLTSMYTGQYASYAISPLNGDIYLLTDGKDVIRIDRSSGLSSLFMTAAVTSNLPDGGTIPTAPKGFVNAYSRLAFDRNGKLYLTTMPDLTGYNSATMWQFDLVNNTVRKYLGGGTVYDATATSSTAYVAQIAFSFDDSNTLYYTTYCTPGSFNASTVATRIMKVTQKADGTVGTFSIVAGNCVKGTPTLGNTAASEPTGTAIDTSSAVIGRVAATSDGSSVYFRLYTNTMYKVQGGKIYSSAVNSADSDFQIDTATNRIYHGNYNEVAYWNITAGNGGETLTRVASKYGTDTDCWNDGKTALSACVFAISAAMGPDRLVYFMDNISSTGVYRLRYVDANNTIRTAVGGKPVYGEGMSRDLVKSSFGSIYYKQSTEPNQAAFPAGLYFASSSGFVMGYVDDNTPLSIVWGNQKGGNGTWLIGSTISTQQNVGSNGYIGTYPMAFDSTGLPWFRISDGYYSISASKTIVAHSVYTTTGYSSYWDDATPGESPKKYGASAYSASRNLALKKDEGVFIFGRNYIAAIGRNDSSPLMRYHDYKNDIIKHIMGGGGNATTPDMSGSLTAATIGGNCYNTTTGCSPRFEENDPTIETDDILYFSEGMTIRKITNPMNPSGNILGTVFTTTQTIQNYIFSMDKKYVYYVRGNYLYCHAISVADENVLCKNTPASHINLGPSTGMANLTPAGDSMTWRSPTRLLINNGAGEIYEFNAAP